MKKHILGRFLLGFCAVVLAAGSVFASASLGQGPESGTVAPDFTLKNLEGQSVSLSGLRGQSVILFFFTTWCPHCREKFPKLSSENATMKEHGIRLLAVDVGESEAKVRSYTKSQEAPFEVLLDSNTDASKKYGVRGVPTFFLVDKNGQIVFDGYDLPENYLNLLSK